MSKSFLKMAGDLLPGFIFAAKFFRNEQVVSYEIQTHLQRKDLGREQDQQYTGNGLQPPPELR